MILSGKKLLLIIIPLLVLIFNALIIFNPSEVMLAARGGAVLWFNSVVPSLLPFMIGTNMLLRLGVVNFIGILLEPIMRPLFGVSGKGAFALAMGATSGYPIGAQVCASLREDAQISQVETQRLLSFVNNSGPLFMIGAIGAGMFDNERVGYFILVTNLIGAILSGMLFKFYKRSDSKRESRNSLRHAATELKNKEPFGKILSESIIKSLESLMLIAGFIILFSVILKILEVSGIIDVIVSLLYNIGLPIGKELISAAIYGFFEITNGASRLATMELSKNVVILCAALVSFGGMSIFSQSIAFLSKTDVKTSIFFVSKLLNAALTVAAGILIYPLWSFETERAVTVFAATAPVTTLMLSTSICAMAIMTILVTVFAMKIKAIYKKRNPKKGL